MNAQLTERQRQILALVVQDYIRTAQPVASGPLVRQHDLGYSAATVRNELAALEDSGLLMQPHTSAGRVPSVAGYRYFVEHLMHSAELPDRERRTIRHQFHQAGWDLERWMGLSAAVVARVSGAAGLVATEHERPSPLRRLELVDVGEGVVQLVAVLGGGVIRQARWRPAHAFDQAALDGISEGVNAAITGAGASRSVAGTEDRSGTALELATLDALDDLLVGAGRAVAPRLYHAGLTQILYAPEFADSDRLRGVVELLEHGQGLEPLLDRLPYSGVQVIIGGEPPLERTPYLTVVLARFGQPSISSGVLCVVGPTRLAYERAVSTVGFVAGLMNQLIAGEAV